MGIALHMPTASLRPRDSGPADGIRCASSQLAHRFHPVPAELDDASPPAYNATDERYRHHAATQSHKVATEGRYDGPLCSAGSGSGSAPTLPCSGAPAGQATPGALHAGHGRTARLQPPAAGPSGLQQSHRHAHIATTEGDVVTQDLSESGK